MMANVKNATPKADQPKVSTKELSRGEQTPNLTYRQTGYKTSGGRSQRDYARK
jgi:hypothetical protein